MSSRSNKGPYKVINNGSMAGNLTSQVTIIRNLTQMSYGYSWAGTSPVGAISVQVSNDYALNPDGTVLNAGTWNTITFSLNGSQVTSAPVSGNTGNGAIEIDNMGFYAIRTLYTFTSGTGSLTATFQGKVH